MPCPFNRFGLIVLWWLVADTAAVAIFNFVVYISADTASRVPTVPYYYFVVLVSRTVEDAGPYNALSDFVSLPRLKGEVARSDGEVGKRTRQAVSLL